MPEYVTRAEIKKAADHLGRGELDSEPDYTPDDIVSFAEIGWLPEVSTRSIYIIANRMRMSGEHDMAEALIDYFHPKV
jgi:hypothetical protein